MNEENRSLEKIKPKTIYIPTQRQEFFQLSKTVGCILFIITALCLIVSFGFVVTSAGIRQAIIRLLLVETPTPVVVVQQETAVPLSTHTPLPTHTLPPTQSPQPTFTSQPTYTLLPTYTLPPTYTSAPVSEIIITATYVVPTLTSTLDITDVPGAVHEVGEWHKEDGLWIRVFDFEIDGFSNYISIEFEIWNKTSEDICFSWKGVDNLSLVDNLGNQISLRNSGLDDLVELRSGDRIHLAEPTFWSKPVFQPNVIEVFFAVENFSRIDKASWRIPVGK